MSGAGSDIVVKGDGLPVLTGSRWKMVRIPAALVACTVNSVRRMPDLEEPVANPDYLIERAGPIACVLYSWAYCYRKLEYAVEPFGKGFLAWLRLLLAFGFFIFAPVVVMLGLCWGAILVLSRLSGVAGEALSLTKSISLLLLGIIGVVILGYLTYVIIMVLMGKPFRAPKFMVAKENVKNVNGPEIKP
jgi:hypothetical protein